MIGGKSGMVRDPAVLRELCRTFEAGLGTSDAFRARDRGELEEDLGARIAALADSLGWRARVTFRLRPIDAPRVSEFPRRLHQHTGRMRIAGARDAELWLNENALDSPSFALMVARLPVYLWLFGAALERHPDFSAELPFFPGDACYWDAVASSASHPGACLVPDPDYFKTAGYADFRAAIESQARSWDERRAVVHWRGSTTGIKRYWPPAAPDDVGWLPRLELCARAQSGTLAHHCDVGYMQLVQVPDAERPAIENALAGLRRPPVEKAIAARCKAVIDIDGNSNAWSGLYCSLLAGACVIKVASEHGFRQWYYDRLEPWVHYVPVRSDFSDLEEHVRLVMTDDELARTVGQAGQTLARSLDFAAELSASVDRVLAWAERRP